MLAGCDDTPAAPPDAPLVDLPAGDPDGGAARGIITTDLPLSETSGGLLYLGAFDPQSGALLRGVALGRVSFPVLYEMGDIPPGARIIRGLLDAPPYSSQPLVTTPGFEDAPGVYLNPGSVVPVVIRPGLVTSRVDFFVTRMP